LHISFLPFRHLLATGRQPLRAPAERANMFDIFGWFSCFCDWASSMIESIDQETGTGI
jgi:hypothetical protein